MLCIINTIFVFFHLLSSTLFYSGTGMLVIAWGWVANFSVTSSLTIKNKSTINTNLLFHVKWTRRTDSSSKKYGELLCACVLISRSEWHSCLLSQESWKIADYSNPWSNSCNVSTIWYIYAVHILLKNHMTHCMMEFAYAFSLQATFTKVASWDLL